MHFTAPVNHPSILCRGSDEYGWSYVVDVESCGFKIANSVEIEENKSFIETFIESQSRWGLDEATTSEDMANIVRVAQDEVTLSDVLEVLIVNEEYMEDN